MTSPCFLAAALVGLALGGLLVGYEPTGGDPDTMYRPIKSELARALEAGTLPFWSDRFGLGVPLVAESHAAAFYPLNLIIYRLLSVPVAYRLAMWLHYVATVITTYYYARVLNLTAWGSALAGVAFSLCGFEAVHNCHEPFYLALPYLPLCLLVAERFLANGRLVWLPVIALLWAAQITLGHFQIPMWTGGLVLLTAVWRVIGARRPAWRGLALAGALAWGAAIAAVQLVPTWELVHVAGFDRPAKFLSNYSFPPAHWAQLAVPELFLGLKGGAEDSYWAVQGTTGGEACFYVGTLTLILAFVGLVAAPRDKALGPWKLVAPVAFLLAILPRLWPDGYSALLNLPGLGYFRAPARYTMLTSLALCLFAGRGFDRSIMRGRFATGVGLAVAFAIPAFLFGSWWAHTSHLEWSFAEPGAVMARLTWARLGWVIALATVLLWKRGRLGPQIPLALVAVELGVLFYMVPNGWGWQVHLPAESPALTKLLDERASHEVRLVAGPLENIAIRVGLTAAYPYLGITPPPPNYLLEDAKTPGRAKQPAAAHWLKRFGVTHGIWRGEYKPGAVGRRNTLVYSGPDSALDRLVPSPPGSPPANWAVERYEDAAPAAHVALRARVAEHWGALYTRLSQSDDLDEAWFLADDWPGDPTAPAARRARIVRWDGKTGEVEHDGSCHLIIRRTAYPGWKYQVNGGPARPVLKADGGLQAVRLEGSSTSRVNVFYTPTGLAQASSISAAAGLAAVVGLVVIQAAAAARRARGEDRPAENEVDRRQDSKTRDS